MNTPSITDLIHAIDLTVWRAEASRAEVEAVCATARQHGVAAVCVNGSRVAQAFHTLEDSGVKVSSLIGFPLGAADADVKRYETEAAIDSGAQELEVVLNIGRLKDGDQAGVLRELRDVVEAADERTVKVLIETGLLTRAETALACQLVVESGAQGVAAGTGFQTGDASIEAVRMLREIAGPLFGVKACGGIPDSRAALALMQAGATRLGVEAGRDLVRTLVASAITLSPRPEEHRSQ